MSVSRTGGAVAACSQVTVVTLAVLAAGDSLAHGSGTGSLDSSPAPPLSERVVDYQIDARLDVERRTIESTEILTYRNRTGLPIDTFPFHLYLQAFQPRSTFMQEMRRDTRQYHWDERYRGSIEVTSLTVPGIGDLTREIQFIHPDDDVVEDHTVFQVRLPRPVPTGQPVQFRLAFLARLPETLARTGYKRGFFMGAQWFPKIGVWWNGGWNCHQFHRSTEFFSDFGTYQVRLTVPQDLVLGASGIELASVNNRDGTKTVTYRAEDVHDFAWAADPNFQVIEDSWAGSGRAVRIRLLMQPQHLPQVPRFQRALRGAMDRFDAWYGPYPYGQITVVDPPHGARVAGMEYPTFVTVGTTWWMPSGFPRPELEIVHEFAHQYWYGMVATNEVEDAWLDEGLTTYDTLKVMDSLFGERTSFVNLWGLKGGLAEMLRLQYRQLPDTDPLARPGYRYMTHDAYEPLTYGKTASALLTLEGLLGEGVVRDALRTYFRRYRFAHPTKEDFLAAFGQATGKDLGWFFEQAVFGTQSLDYAVIAVESDPVESLLQRGQPSRDVETGYRSTVLVHRKGDFILPVELEVKFENGEKVREKWDGRDRWVRFTYQRRSRVLSAEIDPEKKVWLDRDRLNNSQTRLPDGRATRKLVSYWLFLTQLLGQSLAWLA